MKNNKKIIFLLSLIIFIFLSIPSFMKKIIDYNESLFYIIEIINWFIIFPKIFTGFFGKIISSVILNNQTNNNLKCPKCGGILNLTANYCRYCGVPLSIIKDNILKCSKCGETVTQTDIFCKSCGATIIGNRGINPNDKSSLVKIDNEYLKSESLILAGLIIETFKYKNEDTKLFVTKELNMKRNILVIIFGIFTLLSCILFFFNYSIIISLFVELIGLIIYTLAYKKTNILNVVMKEATKNPDNDIVKIIDDMILEKSPNSLSNSKKIIFTILITTILPILIFFNPKIIYSKYGDGYQVIKYTRGVIQDNKVVIPNKYKSKDILAIGKKAFKNVNVETIILPNKLESIKTYAFYGNKSLKKIEIPSTVTEIRAYAFSNCSKLTTVILKDGVTDIRAGAFKNDKMLSNIKLPSTLTYLGAGVFSNCSSLEKISIPKGVTEINGQTFEYCTSLKEVNLHDDIISIHGEVFKGDTSLNNIILPSKITEIRGNTFENCMSLSSIVIPEGVTRIGGHAFYGCSSLSQVTIPSTVTEIGSSAFRQCSSLYNIRIPYNAIVNERSFKESPTSIERY